MFEILQFFQFLQVTLGNLIKLKVVGVAKVTFLISFILTERLDLFQAVHLCFKHLP